MYQIMQILMFVLVFYIQKVLQFPIDRYTRDLTLINELIQSNESRIDHRNDDKLKFNNDEWKNKVSFKAVELKNLDSTVHEKLSDTNAISNKTFYLDSNLISKHDINGERVMKIPTLSQSKKNKVTMKEKIVKSTSSSTDNGGISSASESSTLKESSKSNSYLPDNNTIKRSSATNKKMTKPTKFSDIINTIKRIITSLYVEITAPVVNEKKSSKWAPDGATDRNVTNRLVYNKVNLESERNKLAITPSVDTNFSVHSPGESKMIEKTRSDRNSRIGEMNFEDGVASKKRSKQTLSNDTFLNDSFLTSDILEAIATERPPCEDCKSIKSNYKVPSCKDTWSGKDGHRCKIIVKQGMCDVKNVEKYCQKSCGFCKIPSPPKCSKTQYGCCWDKQTAKADEDGTNCRPCQNQYKHICTNFKSDCLSTKGPGDFMRHHCPETCGVCSGVCRDRPKSAFYCPFWKKDLKWCETRRDLMKHFCPVTCNLC